MRNRIKFVAVVFMVSVVCGCGGEQKAGKGGNWEYLFDGKTLNGWVQHGGKARFSVDANEGAIVGTTVPNTHNSFLCTEKEYGNFILELEFKVDPNLNSGVQFRGHAREDKELGEVVYGYQVDIDPSARAWTGGIYEERGREWIYNLKNNEPARKAFKSGGWNRLRLQAIGSSIKTWINGVPAADMIDSKTAKGFIGLQVHKIRGNDLRQVKWRNIRIIDFDGSGLKQ